MKLFLIRHGETEDNVARLYAGSRDSALTSHGWTQATRLGQHFRATQVCFTHIFSSTLQRAVKTAELIRTGQDVKVRRPGTEAQLNVTRLDILREQDFGSYEGVSVLQGLEPSNAKVVKRDSASSGKCRIAITPPETAGSMEARADLFLETYMLPLMCAHHEHRDPIIAIVSHGIFLAVLWRRLFRRLLPNSIRIDPRASGGHPIQSLDKLGGWSNTGYLELCMTRHFIDARHVEETAHSSVGLSATSKHHPSATQESRLANASLSRHPSKVREIWLTTIKTINGTTHLQGLKRTRGGIGSAKHDEGQQSIESFFKRKRPS